MIRHRVGRHERQDQMAGRWGSRSTALDDAAQARGTALPGRTKRQDVRQRTGRRPGHRRGQEARRTQAPHQCLGFLLVLAVWVTEASVSDNAGGIHLLSHIARPTPRHKAWADTGYRTKAIDHGAILNIDVEVTRRDPGQEGFKVIPAALGRRAALRLAHEPPLPGP
jgi:hypothetical protein